MYGASIHVYMSTRGPLGTHNLHGLNGPLSIHNVHGIHSPLAVHNVHGHELHIHVHVHLLCYNGSIIMCTSSDSSFNDIHEIILNSIR